MQDNVGNPQNTADPAQHRFELCGPLICEVFSVDLCKSAGPCSSSPRYSRVSWQLETPWMAAAPNPRVVQGPVYLMLTDRSQPKQIYTDGSFT